MCYHAEVLELLTFWKPEQQAAHRFRIWRPLASSEIKKKILYTLLEYDTINTEKIIPNNKGEKPCPKF